VLVSYKRVPSSNWIVAAVYPKDEALMVDDEPDLALRNVP
jgi:hypothetical protein